METSKETFPKEMNPLDFKSAPTVRYWVPTRAVLPCGVRSSVKSWTWTERGGLRVEYKHSPWLDGKSDYTLREFVKAIKDWREFAMEIFKRPSELSDYCPNCGMFRSQCECWDAVNQESEVQS